MKSNVTKLLQIHDVLPFDGSKYGFGSRKTVIIVYGRGPKDHILVLADQAEHMINTLLDQDDTSLEDAMADAVAATRKTEAVTPPAPLPALSIQGTAINNQAGRDGLDPDDATLRKLVSRANAYDQDAINMFCNVTEQVLYNPICRDIDQEVRRIIVEVRSEALNGSSPNDRGIPMGLVPFLNGESAQPVADLPDSYRPVTGKVEVNEAAERILNLKEQQRQASTADRIKAKLSARTK